MRWLLVLAMCAAGTAFADAKADEKDERGWTPLMNAAEMGQIAEIKALLAKGANIEASDPKVYDGATPFVIALHFDQHDAAVLLLDRRASTAGELGATAMVLAARSGFDDVVDRLLMAKVSPKGTIALAMAAKFNHVSTIKKLVKAGAVVTEVDKADHGYTPFIVACQGRRVEAAKALLEAGANVDDVDADGTPALLWAVFGERPDEIHRYAKLGGPHSTSFRQHADAPLVALLIAKKVERDVVDADGNNALHRAVMSDAVAAGKALVKAGVSKTAKNKAGKTPYQLAVERSSALESVLRPAS